jgi:tetratricopeptide (TPR) repeat protein/O-antigen ligase
LYLIVRSGPRARNDFLAAGAAIVAAALGGSSVINFVERYRVWQAQGFQGLASFKQNVSVFVDNRSSSDTSAIFLALSVLLLSFGLSTGRRVWRSLLVLLALVMAFCGLLTFSRSVYYAMLIFGFVVVYKFENRRQSSHRIRFAVALIVLVLGLESFDLLRPMIDTFSLISTTPQIRSIQGRLDGMSAGMRLFCSHPFTGVGPGNFVIYTSADAGSPVDPRLVNQAFNLWAQEGAEEGALGLLPSVALGLLIVIAFAKKGAVVDDRSPEDQQEKILLSGLVAILFVNFWQSSLSSEPIVAASFYCMIGIVGNGTVSMRTSHPGLKIAQATVCLAISTFCLPKIASIEIKDQILGGLPSVLQDRGYEAADATLSKIVGIAAEDAYVAQMRALIMVHKVNVSANSFNAIISGSRKVPSIDGTFAPVKDVAKSLDLAIAANRRDSAAWENQGWFALLTGDYAEAHLSFGQAISFGPNDPTTHVSIGIIFEMEGDFSDAAKEYSTALLLAPSIVESRFFKDLGSRNRLLADEVLVKVCNALEEQAAKPYGTVARAKLAYILTIRGEAARAQVLVLSVIRQQPNLPGAWITLGDSYSQAGATALALSAYQRALYLDHEDPVAFERIGRARSAAGDVEVGISYLLEAKKRAMRLVSPHSRRVWALYHVPMAVNNDEFPASLLDYLAGRPGLVDILDELALQYRSLGDGDEADYYERCSREENAVGVSAR